MSQYEIGPIPAENSPAPIDLREGCKVYKTQYDFGYLYVTGFVEGGAYVMLDTPEGARVFSRAPIGSLYHVGATHKACRPPANLAP
jgi:hypothetical protein